MSDLFSRLQLALAPYPWAETLLALAVLAAGAFIVNWITKHLLLRLLQKVVHRIRGIHNQATINTPVAARLANIAPTLVISAGIGAVPHISATVVQVVHNLCGAIIVLTMAIAFAYLLDYVNILYLRRPDARNRPIKGYLQLAKLVIYIIATVLMISVLIDRSPLILLSGVGAMAAVLILVFQDTLLSLVASVQISSNEMVRVGDWLEMPQVNADGDVVDIALHTITVQNWDKTLTIFPTKKLLSDSFKNWRGMTESGGRRIKRSLYLDQTSVTFLSDEQVEDLHRFVVLDDYLDSKAEEIQNWNQQLLAQGRDPVNTRRVTNIGTFRAYMYHYLRQHPGIHQNMSLMVRQLQPGATGLPMEIYCFTNTTAWAAYEDIQSDIFDHLLAILPRFGLRVFQQPSGSDLRALGLRDGEGSTGAA